ncbi:MAG: SGNH/GDSL hydrolase family protein [Aureisphaera sp.]
MRTFVLLLLITLALFPEQLWGQDPHRFDDAIATFKKIAIPEGREVVVFTGSSSIRFWETLQEDCPEKFTINTGFGGSQMTDLLYFLEETVLRFRPTTVYIYEGDNDIAEGKSPEAILQTTKEVTSRLLSALPDTKIYFISAKPSPSRWNHKDGYMAFNDLLRDYCNQRDQLSFIDVWSPMLTPQGRPIPGIFIEDSLHMNGKGYELWRDVICGDGE